MVPVNSITKFLWRANNYSSNITKAQYELVFLAEDLPPLGWATFFISPSSGKFFISFSIHIFLGVNSYLKVFNKSICFLILLQIRQMRRIKRLRFSSDINYQAKLCKFRMRSVMPLKFHDKSLSSHHKRIFYISAEYIIVSIVVIVIYIKSITIGHKHTWNKRARMCTSNNSPRTENLAICENECSLNKKNPTKSHTWRFD